MLASVALVLGYSVCWAEPKTVEVGSIPDGVVEKHKLDTAFYAKYVDAGGIPVVSSAKVRDAALEEVRFLILRLLQGRDDVREAMAKKGMWVGVMAWNEFTTDMPETKGMNKWWDKRARGLGGTPVTCGEENVLNFKGDPYVGESIFIHEFAHGVHHSGLRGSGGFELKLRGLFRKAKESGKFSGYCMSSAGEFWAEGVQSWFDCNRKEIVYQEEEGGEEVLIRTREQMLKYMPEFSKLLAQSFAGNDWRYTETSKRSEDAHLKEFDRKIAPEFSWPAEVLAAFEKEEAKKK